MKKIIQFIKYNNSFTIIFALVLFSTGSAFANEKVRDTVVGQTIITKKGIDNTQIISANLDNFNMGLKIKSVKEDDKFYYVSFDYNAIDAKDNVWQVVKKEKNLNVSKSRLGDMDLGHYLAEELKQLTDQEMVYMKEVQGIEKNKGLQKQVESVEYTGLKGLVFDNETKEIAGYKQVKEENEKDKTLVIDATAFALQSVAGEEKKMEDESEKVVQQITVVKETVSKETIMQMVKEALAQEKGSVSTFSASSNAFSIASSSSSVSSSVVSSGGETVQSSSSSSSSSQSSLETTAEQASSVSSASSESIFSSSSSEIVSSSSSSISSASSSEASSSSSEVASSASSSSSVSSSSSASSESSSVATSSSQSSESSSTISSSSSSSATASESSSSVSSESSSSL